MDIKLEKKPWYVRHRYRIAAGAVLVAGLIYVAALASGPQKLRIDAESVQIAEVKNDDFMEYVDVEGVVHPILTLMVNVRESGNVERIVAEEGSLMKRGDTILTLTNPDLMRDLEDQRDEWEKQRISYEEKAIEMEQKTLTLKQQALEAEYELNKIRKSFALEEEEYKMGIRSKAQLEVSADEYRYKTESTRLKLQSLKSDSAMTVIRKELLLNDREAAHGRLGGAGSGRRAVEFRKGNSRAASGFGREYSRSEGNGPVQDTRFAQRVLHRPCDDGASGFGLVSRQALSVAGKQGGARSKGPHV